MSNSESSSDDSNIPPAEECERRCQEFATITDTDSACAMFFLQDRDWDVQAALNAYFEQTGKTPTKKAKSEESASSGSKEDTPRSEETDPEPHRIRIMSWNIDGLDTNNVLNRTCGAANVILKEKPDVVFLQEVISPAVEILEKCPQYQIIPAGKKGYFCAMMLRTSSVVYKEHTVYPFFSSTMGRNILHVKTSVKGLPMELITSHLESTKEHADERKRQLARAFDMVTDGHQEATIVFGGDLNLRDKELDEVGMPEGVHDLWEVTGKRPEAKYTWDMKLNDNLDWSGGHFKPRCRFDRLFLRHPQTGSQLKPVYFELAGIQRLSSCKRFPSDHWAILVHLDKVGYKKAS